MSTIDDRAFRKMIVGLLQELAAKIDRREVEATEFASRPVEECPPGFAIHTITFKVRRS